MPCLQQTGPDRAVSPAAGDAEGKGARGAGGRAGVPRPMQPAAGEHLLLMLLPALSPASGSGSLLLSTSSVLEHAVEVFF